MQAQIHGVQFKLSPLSTPESCFPIPTCMGCPLQMSYMACICGIDKGNFACTGFKEYSFRHTVQRKNLIPVIIELRINDTRLPQNLY
jgi:hypothetical protein